MNERGESKFLVSNFDGDVVIVIQGHPTWFFLTPDEARRFAASLTQEAERAAVLPTDPASKPEEAPAK